MSRGFNRVIIMGNLARDPEIRYTASKQAVAKLTVAVGHQYKPKNGGEPIDQVDFITVVVWGSSAENCEKYLQKGRPVLVEGRIQVRSYETKEGEKRYATEVVASNVVFLGTGKGDGSASQGGGRKDESRGASGSGSLSEEFPMDFPDGGEGEINDSIPF